MYSSSASSSSSDMLIDGNFRHHQHHSSHTNRNDSSAFISPFSIRLNVLPGTNKPSHSTSTLSKKFNKSLTFLTCSSSPTSTSSDSQQQQQQQVKALSTSFNPALFTMPSILTSTQGHPLYPNFLSAVKPVVVWFQSTDLRLHDHAALHRAISDHHNELCVIVPVFIVDLNDFGKNNFGFEKTGRYKTQFLLQSLGALKQSLMNLNSNLVIKSSSNPLQTLREFCTHIQCSKIYTHTQISLDDHKITTDVSDSFKQNGIDIVKLWSNTLYDLDDLPFKNGVHNIPESYNVFRSKVEQLCKIQQPLQVPDKKEISKIPISYLNLSKFDLGELPTLQSLGFSMNSTSSSTSPCDDIEKGDIFNLIQGGEQESMRKVNEYIKMMKANAGDNQVIGIGSDFSYRMSPWLSVGCISARKMYWLLVNEQCPDSAVTTTYFELVWRDFFRFITAKYNVERDATNKSLTKTKTPVSAAVSGSSSTLQHGSTTLSDPTATRTRPFTKSLVGAGL